MQSNQHPVPVHAIIVHLAGVKICVVQCNNCVIIKQACFFQHSVAVGVWQVESMARGVCAAQLLVPFHHTHLIPSEAWLKQRTAAVQFKDAHRCIWGSTTCASKSTRSVWRPSKSASVRVNTSCQEPGSMDCGRAKGDNRLYDCLLTQQCSTSAALLTQRHEPFGCTCAAWGAAAAPGSGRPST